MGGASKLLLIFATPFSRPSALRLALHPGAPLAALSFAVASSFHYRRLLPFSPRLRLGFSSVASEQADDQAPSDREGFGETVVSPRTFHAGAAHPWPEWSKLVDCLLSGGYFGRRSSVADGEDDDDDSFLAGDDLTEEFVKTAQACLCFARDRSDILRLLAKKDVEIIVENGSPFLFKNGSNSTRRLRLFLSADGANVLESERAQTVDIMRYLLSYTCSSHATSRDTGTRDLIEMSTRNLLAELVSLSVSNPESRLTEPIARQTTIKHGQFSRPTGQNMEMKRGDWICQKCSFMNFARNMKCLKCSEARSKRVFPGGEWECHQCDFFNYGRNMSCLRCDCKHPGESPLSTAPARSGHCKGSNFDQILDGSNIDRPEIERKLTANDEKAERWFSKISQLKDAADFNSAIDDEDFPELMSMRKSVNRFVVSTRKTPLERRLANAQNNNLLANSSSEGNQVQSVGSTSMGSQKNSDSLISQTLDRILGRYSASSGKNDSVTTGGINSEGENRSRFPEYRDEMLNQRTDPDYLPFVPSPDMFGKPHDIVNEHSSNLKDSASTESSRLSVSVLEGSKGSTESKDDFYDTSERWSKKVSELDNALDQANDFPEIMPMHKGKSRFVVSKKKDRSLTSPPQYKRRIAMEQASSSNFVPFPPEYFAKKDNQTEASLLIAIASESSTTNEKAESVTAKSEEAGVSDLGSGGNTRVPDNWSANQSNNHKTSSKNSDEMGLNDHEMDASSSGASLNSAQLQNHTWRTPKTWNSDHYQNRPHTGSSISAISGMSLEGSVVTEPDPLDMSEEAKAARWFRRAAEIKDISELSNIPDEDFPEIMPMRKGVNRFVVSKRKSPRERRLTSPQYRRNMPIIHSEPEKDANK